MSDQNPKLNSIIADIQMLALSLSTQPDPETRRQTLIRIRETSYEATFEVTQQFPLITTPPPPIRNKHMICGECGGVMRVRDAAKLELECTRCGSRQIKQQRFGVNDL